MSLCAWTARARGGEFRTALLAFRRYKATAASIQPKDGGVKPFSALPGPRGLPIIGTLFHSMRNASRLHESIQERHETYGPIFREKLGILDAVFLTDVDAVESLLRQDGKYPSRMQVDIWHEYRNNSGLRKGLLLNEGEAWHALRRVVDRHMLKTKTVESYAGDLNMVVTEFLNRLDRILHTDREIPNPDEELFNWSLESISRIVYEKKLGCLLDEKSKDAQDFINSAHEIFETSRQLAFLPPSVSKVMMPKLYKQHMTAWDTSYRVAKDVIDETIERIKHKAETGEGDVGFITHFLRENMDPKDLYVNVWELMAAAVDTTSYTTLMILSEISRCPRAQDAIYEEITRVVPPGEQPTADHLKEMHYIKAVIKETLRLYPTVCGISRIMQTDIVLMNYSIPKGTKIWMDPYTIGRLGCYYDDPDTFLPERWLRATRTTKTNPFAWLPFGFGVRSCVGRRVAELEMQLLVSQFVRKFRLEAISKEPVQMKFDLLLLPKDPVRIRLTERDSL
ncbi:1,25-dihydroxyvitamin D(3) 24-hydroxylase, mitochondrial-like [Haliotis cracherodii]|uniref:1,25-dihydroxyvitamin D(3) 24-hydroxylase, mitochondrial-like n=1 Tax=Haliotis cracherodii TaxID=6455 RepID=UPI0039EAA6BC